MNLNLGAAFKRSAFGKGRPVPLAFPDVESELVRPAALSSTIAPAEGAAHHFIWRNDVRNLTPRQMSALCGELFLATMINCDEYLMMAFQPELHPDFDRTIGALIGEKADPDRPRDYIQRWTERLDFERRYNAKDPGLIDRTRNILSVLRQLDAVRNRLV
jgi:hypothetical protein